MRIVQFALLIATAIAGVSAPADAQTFLDRLNAKLNKLGNAASSSSQGAPSSMLAPITPPQSAAIDRLLTAPVDDPAVVADRTEAMPLIRMILATGTCAVDRGAWNATSRYQLEPGKTLAFNSDSWLLPNGRLKYHDATKCLTVLRLADWSKSARNALEFTAYYVADDSGEAASQDVQLQKGSDGHWLIRDITGDL